MSITYLTEVFGIIRDENPLIPVLALGVFRAEKRGDEPDAHQRRATFAANCGDSETLKLDTCLLYFRMYGVPGE